jgi:hypothetical protein
MLGATVTVALVKRTRLTEFVVERFGITTQRANIVAGLTRTVVPVITAIAAPATIPYAIPLFQASAIEFVGSSFKDANNK